MSTLEFVDKVALLLNKIQFQDYVFMIHIHRKDTVQLYAEYPEPDTYTGKWEAQRTRRWNLTSQMTDSEIVQTAFKLCLTSMEHRTREEFKYKGARVYGPHFDVEDLVELCKTRENAGGRNGTTHT